MAVRAVVAARVAALAETRLATREGAVTLATPALFARLGGKEGPPADTAVGRKGGDDVAQAVRVGRAVALGLRPDAV